MADDNKQELSKKIDIGTLIENERYDLKLSVSPGKDPAERNQEFTTKIIGWFIIAIVLGWCLFILSSSQSSSKAQEVAQTTLSALIGGIAGYIIGKKQE